MRRSRKEIFAYFSSIILNAHIHLFFSKPRPSRGRTRLSRPESLGGEMMGMRRGVIMWRDDGDEEGSDYVEG